MSELNPITREEMYLAAAAGQDVTVPQPITRREMFLAKLIDNEAATPVAYTRTERFIAAAAEARNASVIAPLEITENGTYTAPEGVDGYNPVTVEVAGSGEGADSDDIDDFLDVINGEVIGEELYNFIFVNGQTEITTVQVYNGYDCADPIATGLMETPEKESTRYIDYVFEGWSKIDGGTVDPDALKSADGNRYLYAVYKEERISLAKGSCGDSVMWLLNPDYVLILHGKGNTADCAADGSDLPWAEYKEQIVSLEIEEGVTSVGGFLFMDHTALTSVSFPNGLTQIGYMSFYGCSSLKDVLFPDSISIILNYAFCGCYGIDRVTIPRKVRLLGALAFMQSGGVGEEDRLPTITFERTEYWYLEKGTSQIAVSVEDASNPERVVELMFEYSTYDWKNDYRNYE